MSAKEFSFTDNNDGTITRTIDGNKYVYNILVDNNIPENESIIDYCYYQHEENLVKELKEAGIGDWSFCSGTCVAMILAIKYGDKNIKPEDVIYFNEDKDGSDDDEEKKEINWTWYTDDKGNTYESGLKDWEKDKDKYNDGGQVYDNRYIDEETREWKYKSINGNLENDEDYLKEIKSNLAIGQPIIIHVSGHFVVVVGVEANVSLDDATFEQLVIFDPATRNEHKIATLGNAYNKNYKIDDYRMIMPYLIDENKEIVRDEHKMPTINPYYLDPVYYDDEETEIVPYDLYEYIKSILDIYPSYVSDKAIVKEIILGKTGRRINYDECELIVKAFEDKNIVLGATVTTTVTYAKSNVATARATRYDPLILDLDGDGYNIEKKELGANFDLDKNGFAEKINWTSRDGFLCLDLNSNGAIDDGGELFGDQTMLADGTKAKNGFEALAQYDGNGDGVIDANDEIFDSLRVWGDADGDGISGEGEMKTLAELGITSINLGYENVNAATGTEATIGNTATFTREDGATSGIGELWVSSDLFDTVDKLDIEISDEIAALPDVKSIGNVYSLRNAMALDDFVNIA